MRTVFASLCVLTIGCSGQAVNSPTSPTAAAVASAATSVTGHDVPFKGSLTASEVDIVTFPTLLADGAAEGTATHLGRYTAKFNATVNVLELIVDALLAMNATDDHRSGPRLDLFRQGDLAREPQVTRNRRNLIEMGADHFSLVSRRAASICGTPKILA